MVQDFSYQLLEQLMGASVRSLCLAALVVVLIFVFRFRTAPVQHALWTIVLMSMLMLPVASIVLPAIPLGLSKPLLPFAVAEYQPPLQPSLPRVQRTRPVVIEVGPATVLHHGATNPPASPAWPQALLGIYLAGVLALFSRVCVGLVLSERLVARSSTIRNSRPNALLEEVASKQLAEYPLPRLYESGQISAPVVVGGEGVSILLPPAWRQWDDSKLLATLAHELTHVRRGDWIIVLLAALNKCVFWFHPLAWWLAKRLAILSEEASDDASIRLTGDSVGYAGVLLEVAAEARANRFMRYDLSALSMAGTRSVGKRIHRILQLRNPSSGVLSRSAWTALIACATPLLSAIAGAQLTNQLTQIEGDVPASWRWQVEGFKTSADEARTLEEQLVRSPDNLAARAKLIAYYLYNAMPEHLGKHTIWVIEHRPDSELAGSAPVSTLYPAMPPGHVEYKRNLWLRQVALHDRNPRVLGNAAQFLMQTDQIAAEGVLKRALELEPQNPQRLTQLARFYTQGIHAGFYFQVGLQVLGPWASVNPSYLASLKTQLDGSENPRLNGLVGASLATTILHTGEVRVNQQPLVDEARRLTADYADSLLVRAQSLDPGNPEWAESLRLLRNGRNRDVSGASPTAARETEKIAVPSSVRIEVAASDQARQLIESTPAVYPPLARQARIQGSVRLRVVIGLDGRVKSTKLVHGHPLLVPPALEAAKSWIYRPALVNGKPVEVETDVDVNFTLNP
jgi:TonB family protein